MSLIKPANSGAGKRKMKDRKASGGLQVTGEFPALAFAGWHDKAFGMKAVILYVDDDAAMLEMFAVYFREQGYAVTMAESGERAMQAAAAGRFDLAIFDINLAGENGLELLSYFKTNHPQLPVVMFTGLSGRDELVEEALLRGASGFMRKQDSLHDLCEAVRSYLPTS